MSKVSLNCVLVVLMLSSCNQNRTGSGGSAPGNGGGGTDSRVRAVLMSPLRGASSVDSQVRLSLGISCPHGGTCSSNKSATATLLASKIRLVDKTGVAIAVVPEPAAPTSGTSPGKTDIPPSMPQNEYSLGLIPASKLQADAAYRIEFTSDGSAVLGFLDSTQKEQENAINTMASPFVDSIGVFTGSLPSLVRIELTNVSAKPLSSARLRFSEPVSLSSLVTTVRLSSSKGTTVQMCPWSAALSKCADGTSTEVSEIVDFVFATPLTVPDVTGGGVSMGSALRGSGRTLGEGQQLIGKPVGSSGVLAVSLSGAGWQACSSSGDVTCVRDLTAW